MHVIQLYLFIPILQAIAPVNSSTAPVEFSTILPVKTVIHPYL